MEMPKQSYFKYALIMTGFLVLCLAYMEISGQNESFEKAPVIMVAMMVAPFIVWWLGIKKRKELNKGKLTFKQGVAEGFKISLAYGILSAFLFLLYYTLVNPAIVQTAKELYQMPDTSDVQIITFDLTVQLVSSIIFGTIYAAIISFFIKSK